MTKFTSIFFILLFSFEVEAQNSFFNGSRFINNVSILASNGFVDSSVVTICNEITTRSIVGNTPDSQNIRAWSSQLNVPEGKIQEVVQFITSQTIGNSMSGQEFCKRTLQHSLSLQVLSQVRAGTSGLVPSREVNRELRQEDHLRSLRTQCIAESTNINCPPHLRILGPDVFNQENNTNLINLTNVTNFNLGPFRPRELNSGRLLFSGSTSGLTFGLQNKKSRGLNELSALERSTVMQEADLCECNKKLIEADPLGQIKILAEKTALGKAIVERVQRKFLNDYAQNREDVSFFLNHRGKILGNRGSSELSDKDILCNDAKEFEEVAKRKCKSNGIGDDDRIAKMNNLFAKFKVPDAGNDFQSNWRSLERSISVIKAGPNSRLPEKFRETGFDRGAFDDVRNGFSQELGAKNFDQVITKLAKDPDFVSFFRQNRQQLPSVAIYKYLKSLKDEKNETKLDEIKKSGIPEVMNVSGNDNFTDYPADFFELNLKEVTAYSPELRIGLSNPKIFDDILTLAQKADFDANGLTVIKILDENSSDSERDSLNLIKDHHFQGKCNRLKEDFANAVCSIDSKIVDDVNSKDLREFYDENRAALPIKEQSLAYLSCQNRLRIGGNHIDLSIDVPKSSYLARIVDKESDFFETVKKGVEEKNPPMIRYLSGIALAGEAASTKGPEALLRENNTSMGLPPSTGHGASNKIWDYADSDGTFNKKPVVYRDSNGILASTKTLSHEATIGSKTPISDESLKESTKPDQTAITPPQTDAQAKAQMQAQSDIVANNYQRNPAESKQPQDPKREELRQSIANPSNTEDVNRFISRVSDGQIEELTKLREQAVRDREKLNELTSDAQLTRIRMLEDQIKLLQTQKQEAIAQAPVVQPTAEQKAVVPPNEFVVSRQTLSDAGRQPASNNPEMGSEGGKSFTEASRTVQGGNNQGGKSSVVPSAVNNTSGVSGGGAANILGETSSVPLVITSTVVKSGSPDLSLEVLRFLETEPDLQVLTQIKDKGLVYRFKVVKDGQEKFEEVTIQYDRLSAEAKEKLEAKIATRRAQQPDLLRIEEELVTAQRNHSYEALRLIIGRGLQTKI